jgi:ornithine cyclodeaminase/alanine dehydrogenase
MPRVELLYLSQREVIEVGITMKETLAIIEGVLTEHGLGYYQNPPKPGIYPLRDAFLHAMPAHLPRQRTGGIKWVSGFSGNLAHRLPNIMGLIVLNDMETGAPTAVLDGAYITAMRTAAVSGVAARHLARADAKTLGIVGAGIQGRYHLLSLGEALPRLEVARIFDANREALDRLLAVMQEQVRFPLEAATSVRDVIEGAEVAVTATGYLDERIFRERWIQQGALALPVHTRGWERETPSRVDKYLVDDWQQFNQARGGTDGYYAPLPKPYAELGQVVAGRKKGRENDRERILNFNFGMAIHDVAMAAEVVARAKDRGLGRVLPYLEGNLPFS